MPTFPRLSARKRRRPRRSPVFSRMMRSTAAQREIYSALPHATFAEVARIFSLTAATGGECRTEENVTRPLRRQMRRSIIHSVLYAIGEPPPYAAEHTAALRRRHKTNGLRASSAITRHVHYSRCRHYGERAHARASHRPA